MINSAPFLNSLGIHSYPTVDEQTPFHRFSDVLDYTSLTNMRMGALTYPWHENQYVVLCRPQDPVGELCHGRRVYGALHTSLRVIGAITTTQPRVGVTSICYHSDKKEIELKWTLAANAPFMGDAVKVILTFVSRVACFL